jgi:hypothetical protein
MKKFLALLAFGAMCTSAEAQGFSAWDVFTASPDLTVTAGAAAAGTSFGMQVVANDQDVLLVRDNTPAAEPRYRARFYFHSNNFVLGNGIRQRILMAQRDSDNGRLITLMVRRVAPNNTLSFLARVLEDSGSLRDVPLGQYPGAETYRFIEFDWQKATAPGANNGRFQALVDGTERANITNLDNDAVGGVDFARMGVMAPIDGSGTLFYDEFESRRVTAIGPVVP